MTSKVLRHVAVVGVATMMGAVVALPTAGVSAQVAIPENERSSETVQVATQDCRWRWTDGSVNTSRTFRESRYAIAKRLPKLRVTVSPVYPKQKVRLFFYQEGRWVREDVTSTNARGVATVKLNPYTTEGTWANGTWKYRLTVVGAKRYQDFRITYRR